MLSYNWHPVAVKDSSLPAELRDKKLFLTPKNTMAAYTNCIASQHQYITLAQ